jgi:glucose/mannose-6-phosphate isomerase
MTDMLSQIRSLGDQLRWAAALGVPHVGVHSEVLYAGMGGSGIAGDYLGALVDETSARITVHKGYGPVPAWAIRQRPLVLAASYSGNTEETISFAVSAHEKGLPVAAVTTGGALAEMAVGRRWPLVEVPSGTQPRAALGQMLGAAIRLLEGSGAVLDQRLAFTEAARLADQASDETGEAWLLARSVADGLRGRIPIIYGGGPLTVPVAQRWKAQINENAKVPAWWSPLPEANHNELAGWESMAERTREILGVVALTDRADHDRIKDRLAHTAVLTEHAVPWVGSVPSRGDSVLARLVSLTVVGDLVSWMLADDAGVDPVPVAIIEDLKRLLAKEAE